jgi:hypothetical protein
MNKHNICVLALIGSGLLGAAPVAQADPADSMLASQGEFQINNNETKTVLWGGAIKTYRVCMEEAPEARPLKVTYDGTQVIVEPGDCQLIQARNIKLASATRLKEGMALIGSFDASSRQKYQTDVSVARAARNN